MNLTNFLKSGKMSANDDLFPYSQRFSALKELISFKYYSPVLSSFCLGVHPKDLVLHCPLPRAEIKRSQ